MGTIRGTSLNFDPEFCFLLELDLAFEPWRQLAAEWWGQQTSKNKGKRTSLTTFFVRYLHGLELDKSPEALFRQDVILPDLWAVLDNNSEIVARMRHDFISDFLDWVLRTHLAELDQEGHRIVPAHLSHPFPRIKVKITGKESDLTFSYVRTLDPKMGRWCDLATEWMQAQKYSVHMRRESIDKLLDKYIRECDLPRNPIQLLRRDADLPDFVSVLLESKKRGGATPTRQDIRICNIVFEFIDWVLTEKLAVEDEHGHRHVPPQLHNPIRRLDRNGITTNNETVRSALSIRYIEELRKLLAEGPNFRDWTWAQQAMKGGTRFGDWFVVDPSVVNPDDPDLVWRKREATRFQQKENGLPEIITELWSPVRAVALYLKLELPLRTFQVRMLDSGEADTWRYEHGPQGGIFVRNDWPLTQGSDARPYQRGVFHRTRGEPGAGIYVNTNKTANTNKDEKDKGYVIPWAHEAALYWLEKLRNWQERYNPIAEPTPWVSLDAKHFGNTPPHAEVLEARGTACFLFRDPTGEGDDRQKPLAAEHLEQLWYKLLARLEQRCLDRGEMLDDGTPIRFVNPGPGTIQTYYPLHALRVSLISYLVLDLKLPLPVVSKLIAGHARIIMTLYYVRFGKRYMSEVMAEAERNAVEAMQQNHRRFLMDATYEQVGRRFASLSEDAMRAAIGKQSAAAFVLEDKGICPVGGSCCDVGGEKIAGGTDNPAYAPVPGYPRDRNCVRCRFFLSGPAFLPGLVAHFNALSEESHRQSGRYNDFEAKVNALEDRRFDCEHKERPFTETRELESLAQRRDDEAQALGKLVNDMQATYYLIGRSLEIARSAENDRVQLVASGTITDIEAAFIQTQSELHQLETVCENAVIYPETDASYVAVRRSQILDAMLRYNGMEPVFMRLSPAQQLLVGNAVMKLIQARTGSLRGALEYAECRARLDDLGLIEETWDTIIHAVVEGTPALAIIDAARSDRPLPLTTGGRGHAS
jgi:hypothetical protein